MHLVYKRISKLLRINFACGSVQNLIRTTKSNYFILVWNKLHRDTKHIYPYYHCNDKHTVLSHIFCTLTAKVILNFRVNSYLKKEISLILILQAHTSGQRHSAWGQTWGSTDPKQFSICYISKSIFFSICNRLFFAAKSMKFMAVYLFFQNK